MPTLAQHQSNEYTKLLIEGDSKSGKTGSLASLVAAGYALRILDFDNGLDVLKQFVLRDCPEKVDRVEFRTLRDERKGGQVIKPKAFATAFKMIDEWKYDDIDLGIPAEWGPEAILVIDSLTFMCDAAFDFHHAMDLKNKDPRAAFYAAQKAIANVLAHITSETFRTNVIVISHVKYMEIEGRTKGFPVGVGSALSPTIPRYFNSVIRYATKSGGERIIETVATSTFDLANPKPFEMEKTLDVEDGLARFFEILRPRKEKPKLRRV